MEKTRNLSSETLLFYIFVTPPATNTYVSPKSFEWNTSILYICLKSFEWDSFILYICLKSFEWDSFILYICLESQLVHLNPPLVVHSEKSFSESFQIEYDMIVMTVFLLIINLKEVRLVHKKREIVTRIIFLSI